MPSPLSGRWSCRDLGWMMNLTRFKDVHSANPGPFVNGFLGQVFFAAPTDPTYSAAPTDPLHSSPAPAP